MSISSSTSWKTRSRMIIASAVLVLFASPNAAFADEAEDIQNEYGTDDLKSFEVSGSLSDELSRTGTDTLQLSAPNRFEAPEFLGINELKDRAPNLNSFNLYVANERSGGKNQRVVIEVPGFAFGVPNRPRTVSDAARVDF